MPRYTAKPIGVEAFQFNGSMNAMPESFRLALRRHLVGGTVEIMTGDGPRVCKYHDWIVRGPDGDFTVMRDAAFEATYAEVVVATPQAELKPVPPVVPVQHSRTRKEPVHG